MLVSEVMLQQTQASRVAGSYESFLERFPTLESLAAASPADVLREWGSLGYNRRALNLHRAARTIVARGSFPQDLAQLPGVGPYTAAAVASFAFGRDVAAVDANVRRVVARVHALTPKEATALAQELVPRGRSAAWNQAMMDLGALVCRPRTPACSQCPVRSACRYAEGHRTEPAPKRREPPFRETTRFARGRIVSALRAARALNRRQLADVTGVGDHRVQAALDSLVRDGVVARRGDGRFELPGASA